MTPAEPRTPDTPPSDAYHLAYSTPGSAPPIPPPRRPGPVPPRGPRGRRPSTQIVVLAIGAVIVIVGALLLVLNRDAGTETGTQPGPTPSTTVAPSGSAASSPAATGSSGATSPSATAPAPVAVVVPVYYVADVQNAPHLYREFHRVNAVTGYTGSTQRVATAVTEMLRGRPVDPDYSSPWPQDTRLLSVSISGQTATVDVSRFVAVGAAYESAAVQQLVYTVTAADNDVAQVRLLVNGDVAPSGHSDWSAPIVRAPALDVLSQVWILAPEQNATVTSPVRVQVYGTGYEGNVPLRVVRDGTVVASTYVTTMMGGFAEAETTIALPPGTYELRAYTDSGRDATVYLWDTKTFTVR